MSNERILQPTQPGLPVPISIIKKELGNAKPGEVIVAPIADTVGREHVIHELIHLEWLHSEFITERVYRNGQCCIKIEVCQP